MDGTLDTAGEEATVDAAVAGAVLDVAEGASPLVGVVTDAGAALAAAPARADQVGARFDALGGGGVAVALVAGEARLTDTGRDAVAVLAVAGAVAVAGTDPAGAGDAEVEAVARVALAPLSRVAFSGVGVAETDVDGALALLGANQTGHRVHAVGSPLALVLAGRTLGLLVLAALAKVLVVARADATGEVAVAVALVGVLVDLAHAVEGALDRGGDDQGVLVALRPDGDVALDVDLGRVGTDGLGVDGLAQGVGHCGPRVEIGHIFTVMENSSFSVLSDCSRFSSQTHHLGVNFVSLFNQQMLLLRDALVGLLDNVENVGRVILEGLRSAAPEELLRGFGVARELFFSDGENRNHRVVVEFLDNLRHRRIVILVTKWDLIVL